MNYIRYFIVLLLYIIHIEGTNIYKHEENKFERRSRRWVSNSDCLENGDQSAQNAFRGYQPLTKEQVNVEFFKQNSFPKHIAQVNWTIPLVSDAPQFPNTVIYLGVKGNAPYACHIVRNKTSIIIQPSGGWKYDQSLKLIIIPLPPQAKFTTNILDFAPAYVELESSPTNTTPFPGNWSQTFDTVEENVTKVIIGSVIGVTFAIFITIFMIVYYTRKQKTENSSHLCESTKEFYYVSYYPENKNFTKEVENFASWGRQSGFNIEMDTALSVENRQILREEGPIRFIDLVLHQAKNVFMVVSPLYLKLCLMDEQDCVSEKKTTSNQQENTVYYEIVSIKNDLVSKMFRGGRFIPVLFNVKDTQLPFWMKELVLYSWPKDANKLLYRLHNLPECMPVNCQSQNTQ